MIDVENLSDLELDELAGPMKRYAPVPRNATRQTATLRPVSRE